MRIVFCYFDDIRYEARGAEELQCLSQIGEVSFVSFAKPHNTQAEVGLFITKRRSFFQFIALGLFVIMKIRPDMLFLHDNYCAMFIPFVKIVCPQCKIVYDMSEIYIGGHKKERHRFINWLLLDYQEYLHLRKADVILAANEERAYVAMGYYALKKLPIVFDNIHRIDDVVNEAMCEEKFGNYFRSTVFTLLYCGGLGNIQSRDIEGLMRAVKDIGASVQLLIAGKNDHETVLAELLASSENIFYLGKLTRDELKFLYRHTDVNVVLFNPTSINTIYCASGKLYEGLFEGAPVLLSQNPPHERLCRDHGIGVVVKNRDYSVAIEKIRKHYLDYKNNVQQYVSTICYENRIDNLADSIKTSLKDN